jgi:DNA-binding IclR family transcriptional regulator
MPIKMHSKRPSYLIESVDSVLRLLRHFDHSGHLRISDVADDLGVARSTAHRLMAMLIYHGFAIQDERSREYRAGPVLHELGLAVVRDMDLRQYARPILEQLRDEAGESVNLAIPYGQQILYVDCVESRQILKVGSRVGTLVPAHCVSLGKALLATLSREQLRELYPSSQLPPMTGRSVRTRARLERELEDIRRRGYGRSFGESEEGVCSIAIAVTDYTGRARAGVSVAAPAAHHSPALEAAWVAAARRAASAIQTRLWGSKDLSVRKQGQDRARPNPRIGRGGKSAIQARKSARLRAHAAL